MNINVRVPTNVGILTSAGVQSMVSKVNRMQDLLHPNVMSIVGVCVGPSIVMPYMANGSLLGYLKRERSTLHALECRCRCGGNSIREEASASNVSPNLSGHVLPDLAEDSPPRSCSEELHVSLYR